MQRAGHSWCRSGEQRWAVGLLGLALLIAFALPMPARAQPVDPSQTSPSTVHPAPAVVVGTAQVETRSCPEPSGAVRGTVALGAAIEITDAVVDGCVPVRFDDIAGFVLDGMSLAFFPG